MASSIASARTSPSRNPSLIVVRASRPPDPVAWKSASS